VRTWGAPTDARDRVVLRPYADLDAWLVARRGDVLQRLAKNAGKMPALLEFSGS
jgi:hypothetical protein